MSNITDTGCLLCPRRCAVNRSAGAPARGYCGETEQLRIASASIHQGEEPPITGKGGSGTIFISGCNLRCSFCQNYQISRRGAGAVIDDAAFTAITLALQEHGAENINIVTGSHQTPALARALKKAKEAGLILPVLWNSSAYETPEALALLHEVVDSYLPDLKTLDAALAQRYFNAPDYPHHAQRALHAMLAAKPRQVIIRHLVLPGCLASTRDVLRWFARHAAGRAQLSLMTQYTPVNAAVHEQIPRQVNEEEYAAILAWLDEFEIEDGFYQELSPGSDWLPDFNRPNPFSSELSRPVWHWQHGFVVK